MPAQTVGEQACSDAIVAFLNEHTAVAYDLQDIPSPLPAYYTEVTVTRRYGALIRSDTPGIILFRIDTRQVAKRLAAAQKLRDAAAELEGRILTIDGQETTPIAFETQDPIAPDEGWFSGLTTWTFGI